MKPGAFRWIVACLILTPAAPVARADPQTTAPGSWQFALTAYAFLPQISGSAYFPIPDTGTTFNISQSQLIDKLKMSFAGAFDVHRGRWGFFTDVLYVDIGQRKTNSREFSIGSSGLPAGTTSDVSVDMKTELFTGVGEFRALSRGHTNLDVLAGVRYIRIRERLEWNFTGSLGTLPEATRSGDQELSRDNLDAIVGLKGVLRGDGAWEMPYYLDVGTGGSQFTWQGAVGISRAFRWGAVSLLFRYLDYRFASSKITDLTIGGPMVGATFRW
jgi:hypothetical protein